jgi:hypothetical protein
MTKAPALIRPFHPIRPRPLKHDSVRQNQSREITRKKGRARVTICLAAMMQWTDHVTGIVNHGVVTVSDRRITRRGASEYESKPKVASLGKSALVLWSGDNVVYAEALAKTKQHLKDEPTDSVSQMADIYGSFIQAHRIFRRIEQGRNFKHIWHH